MAFSHVIVHDAHGLYLFSSNLLQIMQEEVCWVEPSRLMHPECFVVSIPAIVTWLGSSITLGPKLFATWILIMLAKPCVVTHILVGRSSVTCLQRLWNTHQFIQDSALEKIELTMGAWFWQLHQKCDLLYLCQMWWVHVLPQALNWWFQEAAYNHFQKILSPQHCHILLYEFRHTQGSRQLIITSDG
jgi:hypothetical protein